MTGSWLDRPPHHRPALAHSSTNGRVSDCGCRGLGQVRIGDLRLHGSGNRRHRSLGVAARRPSEARAAEVALPDELHPAGVQGADRPRHEGEPDEVSHRPKLEVVLPRCHHLLDRTGGEQHNTKQVARFTAADGFTLNLRANDLRSWSFRVTGAKEFHRQHCTTPSTTFAPCSGRYR